MKAKFLIALTGVALVAIGCVNTVSGRKAGAVPLVKDRVEGRYERPANQVYDAARGVIVDNGSLLRESTLHGTNAPVLALEGRVNKRRVWVAVQQVEPRISTVVVQARTQGGGSDVELCHFLEKQIALRLVGAR